MEIGAAVSTDTMAPMLLTTFDFMWRKQSTRCLAALVTAAALLTTSGVLAQNTLPIATPSATSDPRPPPKAAEGDVAVIRARVKSRPVPGVALEESDHIVTGESGSAVVTLRDGTVLTVGPSAVVNLSRFSFEPTTQRGQFLVDLLEGSIRVVTGLLARVNPELFKVYTPTSVVGVRGTDFIVEAAPNPDVRKALP